MAILHSTLVLQYITQEFDQQELTLLVLVTISECLPN